MKLELIKCKLFALVAIALGLLSVPITGGWTVCVFMLMLAVPALFAKKEWLDE